MSGEVLVVVRVTLLGASLHLLHDGAVVVTEAVVVLAAQVTHQDRLDTERETFGKPVWKLADVVCALWGTIRGGRLVAKDAGGEEQEASESVRGQHDLERVTVVGG